MPRVLVIDDEPLIRWALSERLVEAGYIVREASNAAEARGILMTDLNPQVILLDLRLPDVHDLALLREIRASRPNLPVVIMTAHGTPEDAREAERLGVFQFVSKPFDVNDMVSLVDEAWATTL